MENVNAEVEVYFSVVRYKRSFKRRAMLSKKSRNFSFWTKICFFHVVTCLLECVQILVGCQYAL